MSERPPRHLWDPVGDSDSADEETVTGEPVLDADAPRRRRSADPRQRPPDPAGTQPKYDPDSLRPAGRGSLALPAAAAAAGAGATPGAASVTPGAEIIPGEGAGELAAMPAQSEHSPRFQFLLGALAALAAAAVAIAVGIVASPKPAPPPPWSAWRPVSDDVDPAQQIADHVGPEYRLDNGSQLVQVQGGPLTLGGQPAAVAVRMSGSPPALLSGNGVVYELCGNGPSCSIAEGKPSTQRLMLLRREALELALYTFRYVDGVEDVVVTVPPPPPSTSPSAGTSSGASGGATSSGATGSGAGASSSSTASTTPNRALFFRPGDVSPELDRPLAFSLSSRTPTVSTVSRSVDAGLVNQLTRHALYDFSVVQDQQSNPVLLLQPPGLGG